MRLAAPHEIALALAIALPACGGPEVVRLVDGQPVAGRFISEHAYALYGYAAEAEARGDLQRALVAFTRAAEVDPESPEVFARIGAIRCRLAPPEGPIPPAAEEDFSRAVELDPGYAAVHRERARCLLAHGRAADAVGEAERAVALDPDDEPASLLRAEALSTAGRADEAKRVLWALVARRPRAAEARRALEALSPRPTRDAPLAALDGALSAGDLDAARRLAHRAHMPWSEVAVRAAALGRPALARTQAELVLGADPADASARIALAVAADLAGDSVALASALRGLPPRSTEPSPLARLLFAELLARRVDDAAARAWLGPRSPGSPGSDAPNDDALLAATSARVHARLRPK